jgi:hypothetical protein
VLLPETQTIVADLRTRARKAILWGGLAAGTCDLLDPILIWTPRGIPVIRIFQSIASGLLGRGAYAGGIPTAALGIALHFFIATAWAAVYVAASVRLPVLLRRPFLCGPAFGLFVYCVMYYVVLPLSAAQSRASYVPWMLLNNLGIHAFGVGLPIALLARKALRSGG